MRDKHFILSLFSPDNPNLKVTRAVFYLQIRFCRIVHGLQIFALSRESLTQSIDGYIKHLRDREKFGESTLALVNVQLSERTLHAEQTLEVDGFTRSQSLVGAVVVLLHPVLPVSQYTLFPVLDQLLNRTILAAIFRGQILSGYLFVQRIEIVSMHIKLKGWKESDKYIWCLLCVKYVNVSSLTRP